MKTPTLEQMDKHAALIGEWVHGDQSAMAFIIEVSRIIHVWDDLIDKDSKLTPIDINEAFWSLFFTLPNNGFYIKHFQTLNPILLAAEMNWRVSNELEKTGSKEDREIAYIIRSSYADVIQMSALLIGGREWAYKVAPDIRRWVHAEGYEMYASNFDTTGES